MAEQLDAWLRGSPHPDAYLRAFTRTGWIVIQKVVVGGRHFDTVQELWPGQARVLLMRPGYEYQKC